MCAIVRKPLRSLTPLLCIVAFAGLPARAQGPAIQLNPESQTDLGARIEALTHSVEQMQSELEQSRVEIQQLREMLGQVLRAQGNPAPANPSDEHASVTDNPQAPPASTPPAPITEDDWQIMNARVEEHEQVKVASSSRYRLTISGIALFNVFDTSGQVDNLDAPSMAAARRRLRTRQSRRNLQAIDSGFQRHWSDGIRRSYECGFTGRFSQWRSRPLWRGRRWTRGPADRAGTVRLEQSLNRSAGVWRPPSFRLILRNIVSFVVRSCLRRRRESLELDARH